MSLYFSVLFFSFLFPFALSFDKKVAFYKSWKYLFPAISIVALLFIVWDFVFTHYGFWGFTDKYLNGIFLFNLPLEEVLFFIIIPYCCLLIYEVVKSYLPNLKFKQVTKYFSMFTVVSGVFLSLFFADNSYTFSACILSVLLTIFSFRYQLNFPFFVLSFIISIIPFIVVNGILTGIVTPEPIVWYSESEIIGLRIFTIPLEDFYYSYSLLLSVAILYERFKR